MNIAPFTPTPNQPGGWSRPEGSVIAENPRLGVTILHVQHTGEDGSYKYDQPLVAEKGGSVVILTDDQDRVGLVEVYRPTTTDPQWKATYPVVDHEQLGRFSLEAPRGFMEKLETATAVAEREAAEETGLRICKTKTLGKVVANTTFNPHYIDVVTGVVTGTSSLGRDQHEMLGKLKWFTKSELMLTVTSGEVYCGITLAAVMKYLAAHG